MGCQCEAASVGGEPQGLDSLAICSWLCPSGLLGHATMSMLLDCIVVYGSWVGKRCEPWFVYGSGECNYAFFRRWDECIYGGCHHTHVNDDALGNPGEGTI